MFYKVQWSEWNDDVISDEGTFYFFTTNPAELQYDNERTFKLFTHKPDSADITFDQITELTKEQYEAKTGKQFML
jgi:hypothetical protein